MDPADILPALRCPVYGCEQDVILASSSPEKSSFICKRLHIRFTLTDAGIRRMAEFMTLAVGSVNHGR